MRKAAVLGTAILVTALQLVTACGEGAREAAPAPGPAPEVAGVIPEDGALDVPVTALVEVRFSEPLDPGALARIVVELLPAGAENTGVPLRRALLRDGATLVLQPVGDLVPDTLYRVKATAGIRLPGGEGEDLARFRTSASRSSTTRVDFDPLDPARLTPYPSDLLCAPDPDTETGLRLAVPPARIPTNVRSGELAEGDGFSTYPRIVLPLTGPVSAETLALDPAGTARPTAPLFLVDVDPGSTGRGRIIPLLVEAEPFGKAMVPPVHCLLLFPLRPLEPATRYALVVTRRLTDPEHAPVGPSEAFTRVLDGDLDPGLHRAREVVDPVVAFLASDSFELPLDPGDLALVLPFTTRSRENLAGDLLALRAFLLHGSPEHPPEVRIVTDESVPRDGGRHGAAYAHIARIVEGTVACRDFRGEDGLFVDAFVHDRPREAPEVPLEFILTIPRGASEANPAPVLIFLHGINSSKGQMRPIADAVAAEGIACIAIDAVEHGSRQTFPDLMPWMPFLSIGDLARGRDNIRQTQVDLLTLGRAVRLSLEATLGEAILDTDALLFAGYSLGGIVGTPYVALEPSVRGAALFVTGGGFTEVVTRNEVLDPDGPVFGLARTLLALLPPGRFPAESLYGPVGLMQEILDMGDPIPFAPYVNRACLEGPGCRPKDVLLLEVMDDDTIDNRATENLARALGAELVRPARQAVPGVTDVDGPLRANGPEGRTAGLCQFDWVTVGGEIERANHGSLLDAEEGHRVARRFLRSCLDRPPGVIPSAYPEEAR